MEKQKNVTHIKELKNLLLKRNQAANKLNCKKLKSANLLIWEVDANKNFYFFNSHWLNYTGKTLNKALKEDWKKEIHPADQKKYVKAFSNYFDLQEPFNLTFRLKRHDGEYRWFSNNVIPRFRKNGKFYGYIGSCADVTTQKNYERFVRFVLELSRLSYSLSADDLTGKILNKAELLTGSRIGFYHFFDDNNKPKQPPAFPLDRQISEKKQFGEGKSYDIKNSKLYGKCITSQKPVFSNNYLSDETCTRHTKIKKILMVPIVRGGKVKSIIGLGNKAGNYNNNDAELITTFTNLVWDVVERKTKETELKENSQILIEHEQQMKLVTDNIPIMIAHIDTSMKYLFVNQNYADCYNKTKSEIIGRQVKEIIGEEYYYEALRFCEKGSMFFNKYYERKSVNADGEIQIRDITVVPRKNSSGKISSFLILSQDITKRKKAEEELKRRREEFQNYFRMGTVGMCIISPQMEWIEVNDRLCQILDYSPSELLAMRWVDITHPDDLGSNLEKMNMILRGEIDMYETDKRYIRRDGSIIHVSIAVSCQRNSEGKVHHLLGAVTEITERKMMEEALKSSEEKLRLIIENSKDLIWAIDSNYILFIFNREFAYSIKKTIGRRVAAGDNVLFPEYERKSALFWKNVYNRALSGDSFTIDSENIKGNMLSYFSNNVSPIYNSKNEIIGVVIISRDMTVNIRAEMALKESEEKYRTLYENSSAAILITTHDNSIKSANQEACRLFNRTEEDIINAGFDGLVDMSDNRFYEILELRKNNTNVKSEIRLLKRDGTVFDGEMSVGVFRDQYGEKQTSIILRDITEQKRMVAEILESREELRKLASHLQNIREEERTAIAREMHDDIGQLLTSIKMNLTLLGRELNSESHQIKSSEIDNEIKSMCIMIDRSVMGLKKLITELRPSVLNDFGFIQALHWLVKDFNQKTKIKIKFNTEIEELELGENYSIALFRIAQETLNNIAKHANASMVNVELFKQDGKLSFIVEDNGIGFDSKSIDKKNSFGLLGIKERLAVLGGELIIDSYPGKGTKIFITVKL